MNTTTLVAEDPSTNPDAPYMAAQYCDNLGNISEPHSYGHTDWYLPARNELDGMCNLFNNVLNLDWSSTHWASTETNGDRAYYERGDCYSSHEGKTNKNVVRCVRRN